MAGCKQVKCYGLFLFVTSSRDTSDMIMLAPNPHSILALIAFHSCDSQLNYIPQTHATVTRPYVLVMQYIYSAAEWEGRVYEVVSGGPGGDTIYIHLNIIYTTFRGTPKFFLGQ